MVNQPYEELIITAERKKPSAPDLIVTNESSIPRYISNILLIPDAFFSVNGVVTADIGNRTIIAEAKPGALKLQKTHSFNILNEVLNPYEELRLYCWNGLSSDQISGTFIFTISDDPITGETQAEARSQLELNQEVSLNPEVSPEGQLIIDSLGNLIVKTDETILALQDNTELVAELEAVKGAIEAQELEIGDISIDQQGVIDKLTELQAALPDSPDDTDTVAELQALVTKIQESINAINEVKNSVDGQELTIDQQATLDKLEELRLEYEKQLAELKVIEGRIIPDDFGIEDAIEKTLVPNGNITQAQIDAFGLIYDTLRNLQDGFDLNELEKAIEVLKENIPIIEAVISEALHIEYLQLIMRLQATHETFPSLKSAQSGFLFPFQTYYNEVHTALIDAKGNKNFIMILAASEIPGIETVSSDLPEVRFIGGATDSDQGTLDPVNGIDEGEIIFDFLNDNLIKIPLIFIGSMDTVSYLPTYVTLIFDYSNDPAFLGDTTELAVFTFEEVRIYDFQPDQTFQGPETTKRYIRARITSRLTYTGATTSQGRTQTITARALDQRTVQGTARVSLEIQDSNGIWQEYVTSDQIGSVTTGGSPVISRFGRDVNNLVLPSSQSLLRAKLTVTGGIQTSITLILVA